MQSKNKKGFTLIELLVVISIISILSSVVLTSVNSATQKAKAAFIVSSIRDYVKAIESYYLDNGYYPPITGGTTSSACLGTPAPATPPGCYNSTGLYQEDPTLKTALINYMPTWYDPDPPGYNIGGGYSGARYYCSAIDSNGNCSSVTIFWIKQVGYTTATGCGLPKSYGNLGNFCRLTMDLSY